jgi:hypothetical protein
MPQPIFERCSFRDRRRGVRIDPAKKINISFVRLFSAVGSKFSFVREKAATLQYT